MAGRYVLSQSRDGQYYFNLQAGNYQSILTSERYRSKSSAQNGIRSCQVNSPIESRYERRTSSSGQPYFVLVAPNGEVIGRSETYSSNSAMENGISSVKKNGSTMTIVDKT